MIRRWSNQNECPTPKAEMRRKFKIDKNINHFVTDAEFKVAHSLLRLSESLMHHMSHRVFDQVQH